MPSQRFQKGHKFATGRPKGSGNKKNEGVYLATREDLQKVSGQKGYEWLYEKLNDPETSDLLKMKIAEVMVGFELPKLSASIVSAQVETTNVDINAPTHTGAREALEKIIAGYEAVGQIEQTQPVLDSCKTLGEDPKADRPSVEEVKLEPVSKAVAKYNVERRFPEPEPQPMPRACGRSAFADPGNPFAMFGGGAGPQVGQQTSDGGTITDINHNVKFR